MRAMKKYHPKSLLILLAVALMLLTGHQARAQGIADVLAGELVESKPGDFAWYVVKDSETAGRLLLRQAVVGEERVKRRDAQWVETEIVPEVGYPIIYKMLLTGAASDPRNIHKLIIQELPDGPEEVEVDEAFVDAPEAAPERTFIGKETVPTEQGTIEADHYQFQEDHGMVDIWLNDQIKPLGIVQMKSALGEMTLQRYGNGGEDGESAIGKKMRVPESRVEVRQGPTTNFSGQSSGGEE